VSEPMVVQSHAGAYTVLFEDSSSFDLARALEDNPHVLVDANVARLYATELGPVLSRPSTIIIEAKEENKSIEGTIPVFERLVSNKIRRGQPLMAIGGGIVQDICCFIASTLLRGLPWRFVPTTLLAQADSCIGSKSSINLGTTKNILGTFNPPLNITINASFLDTLPPQEIHSGVGEILKVHAIDGRESFDRLATDFDALFADRAILRRYIRAALEIKRRFIEVDEFDRGVRNVFNYGHSFGHAIESATDYVIPHGIAISIGMDMANYVAAERGLLAREHYARMHPTLRRNYEQFADTPIPRDAMLSALMKDKKNTSTMLGLVLPVGRSAIIERVQVSPDEAFRLQCDRFLTELGS
jgi:3-dehydroquinate synthase